MDGACSTNGEKRSAYMLLAGKLEGNHKLQSACSSTAKQKCTSNLFPHYAEASLSHSLS
jgi:hypothetical protein